MNKLAGYLRNPKSQLCVFLFVMAYTFTFIPFEHISKTFRALFVVGTVFYFILERKYLFKDPIFKFLAIALLIPVLSWINGKSIIPEFISSVPRVERLARIFTFIVIAYWLKGKVSRVYWLWGCFVVGFIAACLLVPNSMQQITNGLHGARIDFGIKNAQFTSMFAGLSSLVSLFALPLILISQKKTVTKLFMYFTAIVFAGLSLVVLVISQSRQAWLAFTIAVIVMPIISAFLYKKLRLTLATYLIIGLMGFYVSQSTIIEQRTHKESDTISAIIESKTIPMTSIGIRVNSWLAATDWIKANPILGSSPSAISQVIQQSDRFSPQLKQQFSHLHNFYMETLVSYGFVGLSLIIALYYWVLRSLFIYKEESEENQAQLPLLIVYAFGLIVYWTVINCFETFNSRSFGVFAQTIIFASIYTFYLSFHLKSNKEMQIKASNSDNT